MTGNVHSWLMIWVLLALAASFAHAGLEDLLEPVSMPATAAAQAPAQTQERAGVEQAEQPEKVTLEKLEARLADVLQARGQYPGTLEVALLRPWAALESPSTKWYLEITERSGNGLASTMVLRFRLSTTEKVLGEWDYPVRCRLWQQVLGAKAQVERGVALTPELFGVRRVDALAQGRELVPAGAQLSDLETVQTLGQGDLLEWRAVRSIPLVRKGEVLDVVAEEGLLRITMKAMALEDGARGDFIKVRNFQSRKDVQVEVLNEKRARVHF